MVEVSGVSKRVYEKIKRETKERETVISWLYIIYIGGSMKNKKETKYYEELVCVCGKRPKGSGFYQTAWLGVYWCGCGYCAGEILRLHATRMTDRECIDRK